MIDTVVSVKLPIGEMLRIKRNRLMPDVVTGEEKRICLVSGIYGDELGGQYICGEIIRRIKAEFENLTGIVDVYPAVNPLDWMHEQEQYQSQISITAVHFQETSMEVWKIIQQLN